MVRQCTGHPATIPTTTLPDLPPAKRTTISCVDFISRISHCTLTSFVVEKPQFSILAGRDHPTVHQETASNLAAIKMLFNTRTLAILAGISILSNALPFDTPRQLAPRQKKYSVINVDGGSTQAAQATTVVEATKTVEVVNPGPTVTEKVTTVVTPPTRPVPTTSSMSSSASLLVSTSTIVETPKPTSIFITVTVPQDDGPTQYYDDGMWHTYYRIKSFEPAVATLATFAPSASSADAPVGATVTPSSY